jgi:anaerobic magnesium-protoporphyrin IX monomethyl ester cyclase
MLKKMKAAGCHQVMYGIESANPDILRNIKKRIALEKNSKAIEMAKKAGLTVRCTFMFGNPGETEETIDETIRYSIQLDPDIALYNTTTPYPGTEMFDWAKKKGFLRTEDWTEYDLKEPVMVLPTISADKIKKKHVEAFYRFYFRPKFIVKKIIDFFMLKDIPLYMEGIKSLYHFTKSNISKTHQ